MLTMLITNCSRLYTLDLLELRKYTEVLTGSIDSVYEESYCKNVCVCKITFYSVVNYLQPLNDCKFTRYFNSVIPKYNIDEFIDQTYFKKAKELDLMGYH